MVPLILPRLVDDLCLSLLFTLVVADPCLVPPVVVVVWVEREACCGFQCCLVFEIVREWKEGGKEGWLADGVVGCRPSCRADQQSGFLRKYGSATDVDAVCCDGIASCLVCLASSQ